MHGPFHSARIVGGCESFGVGAHQDATQPDHMGGCGMQRGPDRSAGVGYVADAP